MLTPPRARASSLCRICSTDGSEANLTRASVPPRKSIPQLSPRVSRAIRLTETAITDTPMKRAFLPITLKFAWVSNWSCFKPESSEGRSDAQRFDASSAPEHCLENGARDEHRREEVGQDPDAKRYREALDRSTAVSEKEHRRDERREVRIHDAAQRLAKAPRNRGFHRSAETQLLTDSFEDEDVGVDRHPYGQGDPGDPGEGQGGSEIAHGSQKEQDIQRQRHRSVHARKAVVDQHEEDHQGPAEKRSDDPVPDGVGSQG